jgi:hypothetical protein
VIKPACGTVSRVSQTAWVTLPIVEPAGALLT